jgi:hypothetical protein
MSRKTGQTRAKKKGNKKPNRKWRKGNKTLNQKKAKKGE